MTTTLALSCVITCLLYGHFKEMPTRITIENQFEPVFNLPYPAITLCSPNQMTISSVEYFSKSLIDGNLTLDLETTLPLLLGFYELIPELKPDQLKQLQYILDLNRYTIPEVMGTMPQTCEQFLKRCVFERKLYNCKDLFKPIITSHGYCCVFNSKYYFNGRSVVVDHHFKNRTVNAVGFPASLSVVSDYEPEDAIRGTLLNAGSIRVMLTDWTEFPVDYETHLIGTNSEAYLFLKATYTYCSHDVQLLPIRSRNCYFEDEFKVAFFRHYRDSDCDHVCYVLAVSKLCDCLLFFVPHLDSEHVCKATHIPCIIMVKRNLNMQLIVEQCRCLRDCVSRKYRADVTVGNLGSVPYLVKSRNLFIDRKLNKSTSIMNFMFPKPVYVKHKQETVVSIVSLVSNIGGVFGMFMGSSNISLLEILFYIYQAIKNRIRRRN